MACADAEACSMKGTDVYRRTELSQVLHSSLCSHWTQLLRRKGKYLASWLWTFRSLGSCSWPSLLSSAKMNSDAEMMCRCRWLVRTDLTCFHECLDIREKDANECMHAQRRMRELREAGKMCRHGGVLSKTASTTNET